LAITAVIALAGAPNAFAAITNFANFETPPVHPIALGPDGRTLAVCNLPDARVELFDVSSGVPVPTGNVAVGLDPVSVRFASSNELWVVNHISSSVSIVDVAARTVVATLDTTAGPSDVVFAGTPRRAWVSCSRTNAVMVFDPSTRSVVGHLAIEGERPRAMAASPDGTRVYVAIFESGNGTTILAKKLTELGVFPTGGPVEATNSPYAGADPPPNDGTNFFPAMAITNPAPPRVSHLVRKNALGRWMDDNQADWTDWVSGTNAAVSGRVPGWDLPDRDVAIIDTATLEVSYAHRLMNLCMAIAVNPVTGEISVVGTDGTNEKRFEPVLQGVFLRVNLALVDPVTRTNRSKDLNPHLDYITRSLPPEQRALGIGDPRGMEWNADGTRAYITGMGSRNLLVVDANGDRVRSQPIEVGEGPTGMALDDTHARLYVWNRFSSSISVVDTETDTVVTNVPVFDPTPEIVRKGRRHLYDTRHSGLGIVSCASCHPDARMDRLAWDLGDPAGKLVTNGNAVFHPMKGPMVTQTLQDIITPTNFNGRTLSQISLHWRGDRKNLEEFNPTFTALLARDTQLATNEMAEFKAMLASISFPPNLFRTFSNTLPVSMPLPGHFGRSSNGIALPLPSGNAFAGFATFGACRRCHAPNDGRGSTLTNTFAFLARNGTEGPLLFSQMRSLADKVGMDGSSTNGRAGFGFMHDGRVDTLSRFLIDGFRTPTDQSIADLVALMLCFTGSDLALVPSNPSQDVPAAAGRQITFSSPNAPALLADMLALALRTNGRLDLVLRGRTNGVLRQWLLRRPTQDFQSDRHGETAPDLASVIAAAAPGNEFTAMLVPQGTGRRLALDRDGDGYLDRSEMDLGFDPADAASHPGRILDISKVGLSYTLSWASAPGARYAVEWSTNLPTTLGQTGVWSTLTVPFTTTDPLTTFTDTLSETDLRRFYRVRLEP
jgi:YVTN family beta-propeller protein